MNTKGLDAIVTTIIIILITLAVVAVIAVVVRNFAQQGAAQIDISAKCLNVDLTAVSVASVANQSGNYTVTLKRASGGDAIDGVKVTLFNATANSGVLEFGTGMAQLETKNKNVATSVTGANKLEYTAYFNDASGNAKACSQTGTLNAPSGTTF